MSIYPKAKGFFSVIAISLCPSGRNWSTISFASTLYLCPILDLLLADIPHQWQAELRLGLQEALVNAAKHGNKLDPSKKVLVQFSVVQNEYWWVISDQGGGFSPPSCCDDDDSNQIPDLDGECGRGVFILYQIFDQVDWNSQGTELRLCKRVKNSRRFPLVR